MARLVVSTAALQFLPEILTHDEQRVVFAACRCGQVEQPDANGSVGFDPLDLDAYRREAMIHRLRTIGHARLGCGAGLSGERVAGGRCGWRHRSLGPSSRRSARAVCRRSRIEGRRRVSESAGKFLGSGSRLRQLRAARLRRLGWLRFRFVRAATGCSGRCDSGFRNNGRCRLGRDGRCRRGGGRGRDGDCRRRGGGRRLLRCEFVSHAREIECTLLVACLGRSRTGGAQAM